MITTTYLLLLLLAPPWQARGAETAVEQWTSSCSVFIEDLRHRPDHDELEFDIERSLDLGPETITRVYDALQPLASGCSPGGLQAVRPEDVASPWNARPHVDIAAGIINNIPWIQFVYPAIGEAGPGLASSIVFYDEEAHPRGSHLVSGYYAWESATSLRSTLSSGTIRSCTQHIEFFSYDENGDIADALDVPARSDCEDSFSAYPIGESR